MKLIIKAFSITTLDAMTLSITTFSVMTLSIKTSITMPSVVLYFCTVMLIVVIAECRYADCCYAECRYVDCLSPPNGAFPGLHLCQPCAQILEQGVTDEHTSLIQYEINYSRNRFDDSTEVIFTILYFLRNLRNWSKSQSLSGLIQRFRCSTQGLDAGFTH